MNLNVRAILVWLMLLAVPLQGFASVTKLLCAPTPSGAGHGYVQTIAITHAAAAKARANHAGLARDHTAVPAHQHPDGKCGACASCCSGAVMTPSFMPLVPEHAAQSVSIPDDTRRLASVDLALPERPPRA